jgi:type IV pilus assembly protein PilB
MTMNELEQGVAERLLQHGNVQPALLERARAFQHAKAMTLGRALVELRLVSSEDLRPILEEVTGVTAVDPSLMTVYPDYIESVSRLIPPEYVVRSLVFPIQSELNTIHVCMLNPSDGLLTWALEALSGCRIKPLVGQELLLCKAIEEHYGAHLNGHRLAFAGEAECDDLARRLIEKRQADPFETYLQPAVAFINRHCDPGEADRLETMLREPCIIQLVHQMLTRLVGLGASDIHFEPLESELRVRYRVDGAMHGAWSLPQALVLPVAARLKVMAGLPPEPCSGPLDARISYGLIWETEIDFRFSSLPSLYGEKVVLRVLERSRELRRLTELGLEQSTLMQVQAAAHRPTGLILVTGPTGSGKTSSLYALLDSLNRDEVNVVTAEEPVESRLPGVTQVPCGEDVGIHFATALRSFLRQDPDVILVGEIRDQETADISLKAALTGHLVLSTLHTNDAPSTILRLLNMGLDPFSVASTLRLVLAQRLVRVLCRKCKDVPPNGTQPSQSVLRGLSEQEADLLSHGRIYAPVGCPACRHTGFQGRSGIFEALVVTEAIEELIVSRPSVSEIRRVAQEQGMKTLRECGLTLVAAGVTSLEEVLSKTTGEAIVP